jgi:lysophospholipase L1-like esterase
LARYSDLSWHPLVRQLDVSADVLNNFVAAALHINPATLADYRRTFADSRAATVKTLLTDPDFTRTLDRLPFKPGDRVAVLGDSMSADALSWANLLRDVLDATHHDVEVINQSVTGRTTAEAITAFPALLAERPTIILILLGVNDARRYANIAGIRVASANETRRNLSALREMAALEAGTTAILITPPPAAPTDRPSTRSLWKTTDLDQLAAIVRDIDKHAVELRSGATPPPGFWLADGVHPSAAGQVQILRTVIAGLASCGA